MTGKIQPPDVVDLIKGLRRDVYNLQRRINEKSTGGGLSGGAPTVLWTMEGPVTAVQSHALRSRGSYTAKTFYFQAGTAASTTTTVELRVNDVALASLAIPAGATYEAVVGISIGPGDLFRFAIPTVGTGLADIQLQQDWE